MKNPHAAALGRLGGLKGGPARAVALSRPERVRQARQAAQARWMRRRFRILMSLIRASNMLAKARMTR